MATLKDVAKLACVDVSTVSRALNNTSYVHPDTKARILAAVKELSYQPHNWYCGTQIIYDCFRRTDSRN